MVRTRRVQLVVIVLIAFVDCSFSQTSASSPKTAVGRLSSDATIQCVSKQFGFTFTLPADWRGYRIVMGEWNGDENIAHAKGPMLSIRHPHWTEENHRQDIPIMIFTHPQWSLVEHGRLIVNAAPFDPEIIGQNRTYVFALPARYTSDADEGYEEVIEIMKGHPLHAF